MEALETRIENLFRINAQENIVFIDTCRAKKFFEEAIGNTKLIHDIFRAIQTVIKDYRARGYKAFYVELPRISISEYRKKFIEMAKHRTETLFKKRIHDAYSKAVEKTTREIIDKYRLPIKLTYVRTPTGPRFEISWVKNYIAFFNEIKEKERERKKLERLVERYLHKGYAEELFENAVRFKDIIEMVILSDAKKRVTRYKMKIFDKEFKNLIKSLMGNIPHKKVSEKLKGYAASQKISIKIILKRC